MLAPTGTPANIVKRLNDELAKVMQNPELKSRIASEGSVSLASTPQEFAAHMSDEKVKWAKVVEVSGATAQ